MKFSAPISALAFALSAHAATTSQFAATSVLPSATTLAAAAQATTLSRDRCSDGRFNVEGIDANLQPWVDQLYKPCVSGLASDGSDFWKRRSCVAAAVGVGPRALVDYATCDKPSIPEGKNLPYLDYGVFASIVGNCAYDQPACNVTHQNVLDLVYGELSAVGASEYPADVSEILEDVIDPIFVWAVRGDAIPYDRFNDWLLHAGYLNTYTDPTHTSGKTYQYDHERDSV